MLSFEEYCKACQCVRREWIWFLTLALFLSCTITVCRQIRERVHFSRDMSYKSQAIRFIENKGAKANWCFLGSSLTYTGFVPEEFERESINLAGESFNIDICSKLFALYVKDLSGLEIVVVETSTVSLLVDTIERRASQNQTESFFDWGLSCKQLAPPMRYAPKLWVSEMLMPVMRDPIQTLLLPLPNSKRLSKKYRSYKYTQPGYVALKPRGAEDDFPEIKKNEWKLPSSYWQVNDRFIQEQISSLERIQNRCRKSNIQFAIVLPPLHSSARDTEVYEYYREVVSNLIELTEIDKSHVCDCTRLVSDEHFCDPAHMDYIGSQKYSKYVHNYFRQIIHK